MRILVTGGTGFIGRYLVHTLLAEGHDVTIVDSRKVDTNSTVMFLENVEIIHKRSQDYFSELLSVKRLPGISDILGDVGQEYDVIFDLAARARVGASLEKPEEYFMNNVGAVLAGMAYCRAYPKTKYIFVSSSSVKFADLTKNPYALTKKMGEDMVNLYRTSFGVNATSARLFNVYGPGEADYGIHTTLVRACKKAVWTKQPLAMFGDGSIIRDFTHVDDVVDGLIRIMREGNLNPLYELGSGAASITVKDVVDEFVESAEIQVVKLPPRQGDAPITCADKSLRPDFWFPKIDVLQYVREWVQSGCPMD